MKFYITTPLYYVNAEPHLGHAYTTIAGDTLARWQRFLGKDVYFLTGTDEHGEKISKAANSLSISPKELADRMVKSYKKLWENLSISYDGFIRTTDEEHIEVVRKIFGKLLKKKELYKGAYKGYYCISCETYITKSICPDCGRKGEILSEESYFFPLSRYGAPLLKYIEDKRNFISPSFRRKEVINFINQGLTDLSITRKNVAWGIPIDGSTIYVWFDALVNYLSGIGYLRDKEKFERYWPPDVQLIGKDILRFHHIIWPSILFSLNLPLPKKIFAHGWWLSKGEKMSKSKGNVISPQDICEEFGANPLRYFLMREITFGLDGDFNRDSFIKRYNSDLVNDLGNLLHRTAHLLVSNFSSKIPSPGEASQRLAKISLSLFDKVENEMEKLNYSQALADIWELIGAANKYLDETSPWSLPKEKAGPVLYNVCESLRFISIFLSPFLPSTCKEIRRRLGIKGEINKEEVVWGRLTPGNRVIEGSVLFPRKKQLS